MIVYSKGGGFDEVMVFRNLFIVEWVKKNTVMKYSNLFLMDL